MINDKSALAGTKRFLFMLKEDIERIKHMVNCDNICCKDKNKVEMEIQYGVLVDCYNSLLDEIQVKW